MKRRDLLHLLGAAGMASFVGWKRPSRPGRHVYDAVVVGAGVFGAWTARALADAGRNVAVVEAAAPAHGGASSGGESRVTRCGYGSRTIYAEWACESIADWHALSRRAALPLFHDIGVLWLHREGDAFAEASARTLAKLDVAHELLTGARLRSLYPVLRVEDGDAGLFEPGGGGLMARRAVQQLANELAADGVDFLHGSVRPIRRSDGASGALPTVTTVEGDTIEAESFVFACGPWLDRVCPDAMGDRLFVTRQPVLYFAADREDTGPLPVWADLPFYGLPSLEGRGFKVADDTHGPRVDPDTMDRRVGDDTVERARAFLARRFPSLADRPVTEARVCQYANSSSGDFVIDRHPGLENAWLLGCGSGHGFKHGPALGRHVARLVTGEARPIDRFSLAGKGTTQRREVQ